MLRISPEAVPFSPVTMEGASGCEIRELITAADGAPTFAMRHFEIATGGHTPYHSHPWEHEVYILSGSGYLRIEDGHRPFTQGDAVYVAPGEEHSFVNDGSEPLQFLCMIPVAEACCR